MEKKIKEAKAFIFAKILRKNLLLKGIKYDPHQSVYNFTVGKCDCTLTVNGQTIMVENHTTKKVDYYNFGSRLGNSVFVHSRLTASSLDEMDITHSDVYYEGDHLLISTAAAVIDTDVTYERCANKVLFFSDMLIGDTIYDTLDNLHQLDGTFPKSVTQDVARLTAPEFALSSTIRNEKRILGELKCDRVRR